MIFIYSIFISTFPILYHLTVLVIIITYTVLLFRLLFIAGFDIFILYSLYFIIIFNFVSKILVFVRVVDFVRLIYLFYLTFYQ